MNAAMTEAETATIDPASGSHYVCNVCGPREGGIAWHCPACDAHMPMHLRFCSACESGEKRLSRAPEPMTDRAGVHYEIVQMEPLR